MNNEEKTPEQQLEDMTNVAKRAMADLANFKRQAAEERTQLMAMGKITVLTELLPVVDNLSRAFAHVPEDLKDNDWVKGVQNVKTQFEGLLSASGLEEIPTTGPINPNLHEVVTTAPGETDQIVETLEKGYTFNGKVMRAAKVVAGQ
jgi:molecular chaperone GrpE